MGERFTEDDSTRRTLSLEGILVGDEGETLYIYVEEEFLESFWQYLVAMRKMK